MQQLKLCDPLFFKLLGASTLTEDDREIKIKLLTSLHTNIPISNKLFKKQDVCFKIETPSRVKCTNLYSLQQSSGASAPHVLQLQIERIASLASYQVVTTPVILHKVS